MIATLAEIKVLLQITDTAKDALITALIPILESDIFDYCKSTFSHNAIDSDGNDYIGGTTISFTALTSAVSDSDSDMPFIAGQKVYIEGSKFNDGFKSLLSGSVGSFVTNEAIENETAGNDIKIKVVILPASFKSIMADYVDFKINKKEIGVVSESVPGGFSKSYSGDGGEMPEGIKARLNKYRCIGVA